MNQSQVETKEARAPGAPDAPVLSASVRRHLGKNLRSFYAGTLAEPVGARMEALLASLDAQKQAR